MIETFVGQFMFWLQDFAPKVILTVLTLALGWWVARILSNAVKKAMQRARIDAGIISFLGSIITTILRIIVIVCAIARLGVNVNSIVAAIGAAGVTIGLALKDSLANIASGTLIIVNKPFHIGDYLEIGAVQGRVTKIEMMFTTLTTDENKSVIIPNSLLTESTIVNCRSQKTKKLELTYSISHTENILKVKNLLKGIIEENALILREPAPVIGVGEISESGVDVIVKIWCEADDYSVLYHKMQEDVKLCFDENNISHPRGQIQVHSK